MITEQTIPAVLRAAGARFGDHPAYVEGDRTLSYAELLEQVQATARGLVAHGLGVGDRVVLWAPNSTGWALTALAVTYAGGVLVPANSRYTGAEVAALVERTAAPVVVLADGFLGRSQRSELAAARGAGAT